MNVVVQSDVVSLKLEHHELNHVNCKKTQASFLEHSDKDWEIDCEGLQDLPLDWLREILLLNKNLTKTSKKLTIKKAGGQLRIFLKNQGVFDRLTFAATAEQKEAPKKIFDTNVLNPFIDATVNTLKVQANVESKSKQIYIRDKNSPPLCGDVSGVIGLVSEKFSGTVSVSFPEKTFLNIMSKMLGENYTQLSPDLLDGASEILNIIFGQAKTILNEKGYGIKMALPKGISGKNHSLSSNSGHHILIVPFESDSGDFFVEIELTN